MTYIDSIPHFLRYFCWRYSYGSGDGDCTGCPHWGVDGNGGCSHPMWIHIQGRGFADDGSEP